MDFSPWDWASSFRLHEAACLIAGVMPLSKRVPDREELPAPAIPIMIKLASAYVGWLLHYDKADNPEHPKDEMLKGVPMEDGSKPVLPIPLAKLTGELVYREELHRWIHATGRKSVYQFLPVGTVSQAQINSAPATSINYPVVVSESGRNVPSSGKVWTPEKLAEMKAYRAQHGTKKAAAYYQITDARIRQLLPGEKRQPKGYSVFTHRVK